MFSKCFKNGVFKPTEDWIDKPTDGWAGKPTDGRVLWGFREVFFDGFQKGAKKPDRGEAGNATVVGLPIRPWSG